MDLRISSHLKGEEKEKFEELWRHQTMIRHRLEDILTQKIEAAERERISEKAYAQASWPYKQADSNGFIRALKDVLQLIKENTTNNV
jgi:hypothetical protein